MKIFTIGLFIAVLLVSGCTSKEDFMVYDLQCESLKNPLGIDNPMPRFSWKIKSIKNGTEQKYFQLLVASDVSTLEVGKADFWDSGKVKSSSSILVPYQGEILNSGSAAFWKVRIWDEAGNVSPWSAVSGFSIGLLDEENWHASYIGFPSEVGFSDCPQLKKSFQMEHQAKRMFLYVNSLGYHEVYLNGKKVGDGVLNPAVSQFDKRSRVITYDVSSYIKKGNNDLVLWLGSGWYSSDLPGVCNNGPLVKAQLEQSLGNQREIVLVTDSLWEGRSSGYTRIDKWRDHHFGGEELNGSVSDDLSAEKINNRPWSPVSVVSVPFHEVSPQMVEFNQVTDTLDPVSIIPLSEKSFLVDMGKCMTGWMKVRFPKLQKSQEILMEYCDHLDEKGQFVNQNQLDRYIASGEGQEVFKNKFNYHGFRYIRISNMDVAPALESIHAYLIHTGYDLASGFQCSDPELNKIHDMLFYTLRCLSLGGYLVDCPQIERLGYGGDGNASTVTAQTMFNLNPLYKNWLQAWGDCIRDDGGMPHTAPNPYAAGGGPYWCGFIITATWNTYLNYGDSLLLKNYYPTMQKWLGYVDKYTVDGLLKRWPDNDYRGWYLGDWACPVGVDQTAEASVDLVNNCFVAVCYDDMLKIAKVLGKTSDVELYTTKKEQLATKINQVFFDKSKNIYATGSQIDLTYPLLAGVVPEQLVSAVKSNLVSEIMNNRNGHFACGLVGIPVFTEWVIKNQEADLMYTMLKKRDYPGYLYMIENGATTTWEHWNGERSWIHNCYNGIGSWFYQAVGGIRPDDNVPAYQKVIIQPQIPQGITWAKTFKETPYGKLAVNWLLKGKMIVMELVIPVGIDAEVVIPSGVKEYRIDGKSYYLSGKTPSSAKIKSGKYTVAYEF